MLTRVDFEAIRPKLEALRKATRPRTHDLYDVFCEIIYVIDNDVPWRTLQACVPWRTAHEYFLQWQALLPDLLAELDLADTAEKLARRVAVSGNSVKCFLVYDNDPVCNGKQYGSKTAAVLDFYEAAVELDNIGQRLTATLHIADTIDQVAEYPDFVLSLGPRGGVKIEKV